MNNYTIGIDPGVNGAIAVLKDDKLITVFDMPTRIESGKKQVDAPKLYELLLEYKIALAVVESVHAMPKQGVTSSFNFGRSFGVILGVLAGSEIPVKYVTPQAWKKRFSLIGTEKDAAREKIIHMMPQHKDLFLRKKDVDRADAVFIGLMK